MLYTSYDRKTGKILAVYGVSDEIANLLDAKGKSLIEGDSNGDTQYVDVSVKPHKIVPRPAQPTLQNKTKIKADGVDLLVLDNLPCPCEVYINSEHYLVEDGVLEWATYLPVMYKIQVIAFPYCDYESEVVAS